MLVFTINLTGTDADALTLKDCLTEWDDSFEDLEASLEVTVDELYDHIDAVDEMESLAVSIAEVLPENEFTIKGYIDTSELAGEYMDFLITYENHTLVSKHSCWYIYMYAADFDEYEDFAKYFQGKNGEPRFTEEQFEAFRHGEYFILNSGDGDCVEEVPLAYESVIDLNRQEACPVCGESLYKGVPVCEDAEGIKYHIWCAEKAGKETEIVIV